MGGRGLLEAQLRSTSSGHRPFLHSQLAAPTKRFPHFCLPLQSCWCMCVPSAWRPSRSCRLESRASFSSICRYRLPALRCCSPCTFMPHRLCRCQHPSQPATANLWRHRRSQGGSQLQICFPTCRCLLLPNNACRPTARCCTFTSWPPCLTSRAAGWGAACLSTWSAWQMQVGGWAGGRLAVWCFIVG